MELSSCTFERWHRYWPKRGFGVVIKWLAIALVWPFAIQAQEFYVRNWHIEDGLPDATVTALAQTPDGYLWAGTTRGLVRFDGTQFKVFAAGPESGLAEAHITALLVDHQGVLWAAGLTDSLAYYEGGRFHTVSPASGSPGGAGFSRPDPHGEERLTRWMWGHVAKLAEDAEHAIWLVRGDNSLLRWWQGQFTRFTTANGLPAGQIDDLCADDARNLWLVVGSKLCHGRAGRWLVEAEAGESGPLQRLAPARAGGVWVAAPRKSWTDGGGWVRRFTGSEWMAALAPTPWSPNSLRSQVTTLLEDRAGRVWLGTLWGGVYYSGPAGQWQRVEAGGAFSQAVVTCLFEDQQGALWVGTMSEGLHRITRRPVSVLVLPPPAQENIITTSMVARDGNVWMGTDGAGAWRWRDGQFTPFGEEAGLTNRHVCALLEDHQTNLWAGTWGGLFRLQDGRFTREPGCPELDLSVLALFEDRSGRLWIGTPRGPVCRENGAFKLHPVRPPGEDVDIRAFVEDASGSLWVGAIGQGLFRLNGDQVEQFGPAQGFASHYARSLYVDAQDTLWVGTHGSGLFRYKAGRFTAYDTSDGLPSDTISSIMGDDSGNLWMGSDNGIFLCRAQQLQTYARGRSPALLGYRLGVPEGLRSRSCSGSGQPVCAKSADGKFWFPNMRGLAVFDPAKIAGEKRARRVLVESVVADGTPLAPNSAGECRAPSTAKRFEFHYTVPDLSATQPLRFRHLLGGMDRDWVEAGAQRVAYYSQLPPGRYQFRVMAGSGDGQWQECQAAFALQVVPRWWELRWVQVLAGVLLTAGVAGGITMNERRKLRRRLERLEMQQALEGERRRIARDLHDDLGSRLTEIVLLGELAKRGEQTPVALGDQVGGITRKVRQLVSAMEEIVWTVNPKNDSLASLATYLCDLTERFLAAAQLNCRLDVAESLPPVVLSAHARHNLLLAAKEALNNAVRHAAATQVRLRIHPEGGALRVTIEDDGHGFDARHPSRSGNGLSNIRSRLETVGGFAEIHSAPGKGTIVALVLPLTEGQAKGGA